MPDSRTNAWSRRIRRMMMFVGTAGTVYLISSYFLDRLREARARAIKERKQRDLMKSHFSSLMSTISFTLYALLPTLQPQLSETYPVEEISQAIQSLSNPSSGQGASGELGSSMISEATSANSPPKGSEVEVAGAGAKGGEKSPQSVGESWASEFKDQEHGITTEEEPSLVGSSVVNNENDEASSTMSQSISLPPTDISSSAASPPSDLAGSPATQSSPTNPGSSMLQSQLAGKSKKELWKELKLQTLTRSLTTAYLLPCLYLLTSSQLAILARLRYLEDLKTTLPPHSNSTPPSITSEDSTAPKSSSSGYLFSAVKGVSGLVLSYAPNPRDYLPESIGNLVPSLSILQQPEESVSETSLAERQAELDAQKAEDERVFLTYSWWILHEGWRSVGDRVQAAVDSVFAKIPLKRELSVVEWEQLVREVRAQVETNIHDGVASLYSFTPHILPPDPLPTLTTSTPCPLSSSPTLTRPHLHSLIHQTSAHLSSPDANYVIEKGVSAMVKKMCQTLEEELYFSDEFLQPGIQAEQKRRLVDCLPVIDKWGKGVWEGIPDSGVEALLSLSEFEGLAALVFGDWAPE